MLPLFPEILPNEESDSNRHQANASYCPAKKWQYITVISWHFYKIRHFYNFSVNVSLCTVSVSDDGDGDGDGDGGRRLAQLQSGAITAILALQ